jgi:hypothetical protein
MSSPDDGARRPDDGDSGDRADVEAAFADIVAEFNVTHAEPIPPWPADEDAGENAARPPSREAIDHGWGEFDDGSGAHVVRGPRDAEWSDFEELRTPSSRDEVVDPADRFVPPAPPPLPVGDPVSRSAWAGVLGAPALYVLLSFAGWDLAGVVGMALGTVFLVSFVTLVVRMRNEPPDDSDHGAVV